MVVIALCEARIDHQSETSSLFSAERFNCRSRLVSANKVFSRLFALGHLARLFSSDVLSSHLSRALRSNSPFSFAAGQSIRRSRPIRYSAVRADLLFSAGLTSEPAFPPFRTMCTFGTVQLRLATHFAFRSIRS